MANTKPGARPHRVSEKSLANLRVPTSEQAREMGRKGGLASQEKYKKQKNIREMMQLLLSLPVSQKNKEKMEKLGITDTDYQNNKMMVAVGLLQRAITGDPRSIELLCGVAGELETEQDKINGLNNFEIKFVDAGDRNEEDNND